MTFNLPLNKKKKEKKSKFIISLKIFASYRRMKNHAIEAFNKCLPCVESMIKLNSLKYTTKTRSSSVGIKHSINK